MTINIKNIAVIDEALGPDDREQAQIDISTWLDADTIASIIYSAVDGSGETATAEALDGNKHSNTNTVVKPYLKGGLTGKDYTAKCLVTTSGGDEKSFYVKWKCREFAS